MAINLKGKKILLANWCHDPSCVNFLLSVWLCLYIIIIYIFFLFLRPLIFYILKENILEVNFLCEALKEGKKMLGFSDGHSQRNCKCETRSIKHFNCIQKNYFLVIPLWDEIWPKKLKNRENEMKIIKLVVKILMLDLEDGWQLICLVYRIL